MSTPNSANRDKDNKLVISSEVAVVKIPLCYTAIAAI